MQKIESAPLLNGNRNLLEISMWIVLFELSLLMLPCSMLSKYYHQPKDVNKLLAILENILYYGSIFQLHWYYYCYFLNLYVEEDSLLLILFPAKICIKIWLF